MKHSFFHSVYQGITKPYTIVIGTFLVILGHVIGQIPISGLLMSRASQKGSLNDPFIVGKMEKLDLQFFEIDPNVGFLLILLPFVAGLLALYFVIKYIHKRSFTSLITPTNKIDWSRIFFGFSIWLTFAFLGEFTSYYLEPESYVWTFEWKTFIPLVLICIFIFPWQTSFEEIFMRGYWMQYIHVFPILTLSTIIAIIGIIHTYINFSISINSAAITFVCYLIGIIIFSIVLSNNREFTINKLLTSVMNRPLTAWVLTSVIFGSLHLMNPEIDEFGFWKMMCFYIGTGLFLGIITILDERLELALGIHFANNLFGGMFVTFEGSALQTPTILKSKAMDTEYMLIAQVVIITTFIILAQWKYKWKNWGKIFEEIKPPIQENITYNINDQSV